MRPKLATWAFVLAVPDLDRSTAWFRDVLGCRVEWEESTDWRLVTRDGMRLMLGHCPKDKPAAEIGSHSWFGYVEVDDVDALRADLVERGAVCSMQVDQPYGMREIIVTTVDGHRIVFGQQLKPAQN
jgi:catechol 2,3-dioxygenase-like lactoylglutathione lyase family enzyme